MENETTLGGYPIHPACGMLPMMPPEAIAELAQDIRRHGQQQPIWLYDGQLLDGRNRLEACLLAGVEPEVHTWTGDDPVRWVLSLNFHRRHLTDGQKAVVGARAEALIAEREATLRAASERAARDAVAAEAEAATASDGAGDDATEVRSGSPETEPLRAPVQVRPEDMKRARTSAAALVNVSERAIAKGRHLLERAVPSLVDAVERGLVPMSAASTVAELAPEVQERVVGGGEGAVRDEARRIRAERASGKPTVVAALRRLEESLPILRLDKAADGRWRFEGTSPDLDEALVTEGRSIREALASACQELDRLGVE